MAESDQERVTCPGCGKGYRWQPSLAGREVPCKQCGSAFIIPDQPGTGLTIASNEHEDDGLYDLASDPDEERDLPPAHVAPTPTPILDQNDQPPADDASEPAIAPPSEPDDDAHSGEPQVHISEAAKASRREEQRIAAATTEPERSWRDYKWLFILLALIGLGLSLMWALGRFAEFMDDPTPQSMHDDHDVVWIASDFTDRDDWR